MLGGVNRGSAINSIFQTLLMNVAPVVFDIVIATSEPRSWLLCHRRAEC